MPATGPIDRILRGGGSVVVLATGAILATPAAGQSFTVAGDFVVQGDFSPTGDLLLAEAAVVKWGTDTNLYRASAGVLKTDGGFVAAAGTFTGLTVSTNGLTVQAGGVDVTGDIDLTGNVQLDNQQYLRGRNAAGTAEILLVGVNASDILRIGSATGINGIIDFYPGAAYDTTGMRLSTSRLQLYGIDLVIPSGNKLRLDGSASGTEYLFVSGGHIRVNTGTRSFEFADTYFGPVADNVITSGRAAARWSTIYGVNADLSGTLGVDGIATLKNTVVIGTGALPTTATDGFLYIPSQAGVATGVPTAYTGRVPITFDSVNNKIGFYNSGWLWTAALT